jgi:CBS domain-containing membrane protein
VDNVHNEISDEDLKAAFRETKTHVNISAEELKRIYAIAFRHAKTRIVSKLRVEDVMTGDVISIQKYDDINLAVKILSENNISGIPVVDKQNHVMGLISEADVLSTVGVRRGHTFKDIIKHILGEPLPERKMGDLVGDIMTSPDITTKRDADISDVAKIMDEMRIKRLPVVDGDNRLIGIISRGDIVKAMSQRRSPSA